MGGVDAGFDWDDALKTISDAPANASQVERLGMEVGALRGEVRALRTDRDNRQIWAATITAAGMLVAAIIGAWALIYVNSAKASPAAAATIAPEAPVVAGDGLALRGWAKDATYTDRTVELVVTVDVTEVKTIKAGNPGEPVVGDHRFEAVVPLDVHTAHQVCFSDSRAEAKSAPGCFIWRPVG